jgi:glycosyltransferase involved in cell wall biosynthesis
MTTAESSSLSVVIMTFNEEENIERCLQSVSGLGDEILVLDSGSVDQTVEKALALGARVEYHPFSSFADQRRKLIQLAKHDMILILDADEYLSEELRASVTEVLKSRRFDVYTSNRRNRIGAKWLNHGSWYPDKKIRLFDRRKVSVIGHDIHESLQAQDGIKVGHLLGDLLHHADVDISTRFQKVNAYSTRAAAGLYNQGRKTNLLKILVKPCIRFISVYFLRLGLLDGYYGFIIARSESHYVWLRETKLLELYRVEGKNPVKK